MNIEQRNLHAILAAIVFRSIDCEGVDADMNIDAAVEISGDIILKVTNIYTGVE